MKTKFDSKLKKVDGKYTSSIADINGVENVEVIPTGLFPLDYCLGGGFPKYRMVEILGDEGVGKSTLALQLCKNIIEQDERAIIFYRDSEFAMTKKRLDVLGLTPYKYDGKVATVIDVQKMFEENKRFNFLHLKRETLDDFFNHINDSVKINAQISNPSNKINFYYILDSVAGTRTLEEVNSISEASDRVIGVKARAWSQMLSNYISSWVNGNISLYLVNQIRNKISIGFGGFKADPTESVGGKAIKFYSFLRFELKNIGAFSGKTKMGDPVDRKISIKILKNKNAEPKKLTTIFTYAEGYSEPLSVFAFLKMNGFISSIGGGKYSFAKKTIIKKYITDDSIKIFNLSISKDDFVLKFKEDFNFRNTIYTLIENLLKIKISDYLKTKKYTKYIPEDSDKENIKFVDDDNEKKEQKDASNNITDENL